MILRATISRKIPKPINMLIIFRVILFSVYTGVTDSRRYGNLCYYYVLKVRKEKGSRARS